MRNGNGLARALATKRRGGAGMREPRDALRAVLVRHAYRSPFTLARIVRLVRAPSLAEAVGGKVVLVTGASSGIGRATAARLGAAGATMLLVARTTEALEEVRDEIEAMGGTAYVHPCDLRDPDAVDSLAVEVLGRYERVDVLINNAGRSIRRAVEESYDRRHDFERTMRLNYFAALQLILAFLPAMRARRSGHIINVSTMGVQARASRFSAYIASKAALDWFSSCLAVEARADGVRVTSVHPALVRTPMVAPTSIYDDAPALTAEETAEMIAEAVRTRAPRVVARAGRAFELARLVAPRLVEASLNSRYRRSLQHEAPTTTEPLIPATTMRSERHQAERA